MTSSYLNRMTAHRCEVRRESTTVVSHPHAIAAGIAGIQPADFGGRHRSAKQITDMP